MIHTKTHFHAIILVNYKTHKLSNKSDIKIQKIQFISRKYN